MCIHLFERRERELERMRMRKREREGEGEREGERQVGAEEGRNAVLCGSW